MSSVWQDIIEDARFRSHLQTRGRRNSFLGVLPALFSRGALVVTTQRLCRAAAAYPQAHRDWRYHVIRLLGKLGYALSIVLAKSMTRSMSMIAGPIWVSDRGHVILGIERVGGGTVIHDRVTIGMGPDNGLSPVIGENVWIGRNCVIFGAIQIGDGATILPGSIVSKRVPPRAVVSGNPGRIVMLDFDNGGLRSTPSANAADEMIAALPKGRGMA